MDPRWPDITPAELAAAMRSSAAGQGSMPIGTSSPFVAGLAAFSLCPPAASRPEPETHEPGPAAGRRQPPEHESAQAEWTTRRPSRDRSRAADKARSNSAHVRKRELVQSYVRSFRLQLRSRITVASAQLVKAGQLVCQLRVAGKPAINRVNKGVEERRRFGAVFYCRDKHH